MLAYSPTAFAPIPELAHHCANNPAGRPRAFSVVAAALLAGLFILSVVAGAYLGPFDADVIRFLG